MHMENIMDEASIVTDTEDRDDVEQISADFGNAYMHLAMALKESKH